MISAEAEPYAKAGGLADMVVGLSRALLKHGVDVRILIPCYSEVRKSTPLVKLLDLPHIKMGTQAYSAAIYVESHQTPPLTYFISNHELFDREGIYNEPASGEGFADNFERFNFFMQAALDALPRISWKPDLLHCHDSQTALIPAFLKLQRMAESFYQNIATVFTIHNVAYQGIFEAGKFPLTGLPPELFYPMSPFEYYGRINLMKAGILYADLLNTVSPTYAREIQENDEYGAGLAAVLRQREGKFFGILNGIDTIEWDPRTDRLLYANYSERDLSGKLVNKQQLRELCGLPVGDAPLIGMISRLVDQKGLDLLFRAKRELARLECQWVILGTGVARYHQMLQELAEENSGKFWVRFAFDNKLAHRIEAGCDLFLMPSRYEPCGLNQMYSMRYGTVPIVRNTGGLADTVTEFHPTSKKGNGFKFQRHAPEPFLEALHRALDIWRNRELWSQLVQNCMCQDFSWDRRASEYIGLYHKAIAQK